MAFEYLVFFISTGLLLSDVIYSILNLDNSCINYNLEIHARNIKDDQIKQLIVNSYVKDYGLLRSLIKVFAPLAWNISGLFTQHIFLIVGLFILKIVFRMFNGDDNVGESTYLIRLILYLCVYLYIFGFFTAIV